MDTMQWTRTGFTVIKSILNFKIPATLKNIIILFFILPLNAVAQKDTQSIQCIPRKLEQVFASSDYVIKVCKLGNAINQNKPRLYKVLRELKRTGYLHHTDKSIYIFDKKTDMENANSRLSKINMKMKVFMECYSPQYPEKKDTLIYFLKRRTREHDKKIEHFITTVANGYEGIQLEEKINGLCKEYPSHGIYCGSK